MTTITGRSANVKPKLMRRFTVGGTATCTEKAVCEVCGASYGEFGEHTWGEPVYTWSEDGKNCTGDEDLQKRPEPYRNGNRNNQK